MRKDYSLSVRIPTDLREAIRTEAAMRSALTGVEISEAAIVRLAIQALLDQPVDRLLPGGKLK